ncbi:pentapeptide repeat-containing protein [Streptomyces asiaticus]
MAATPSRRSGRATRLQRVARRRTPAPTSPAARQSSVTAPTDWWTRIQQLVGTVAALGTLVVIVFSWQSIEQVDEEHALTREEQVTDRYNAAVEDIGEDSQEIRLNGIYALQRIMEDSPRDQPSIINVLSAYIRNHAKKPKRDMVFPEDPASDIQAALNALGYRNPLYGSNARIDLHGAYLSGAYLPGANLKDANLTGADLRRANLHGANRDDAKR